MRIYSAGQKYTNMLFFQFLFFCSFYFPSWIEMSIKTYVFKYTVLKYMIRIFLKLFIFIEKYV